MEQLQDKFDTSIGWQLARKYLSPIRDLLDEPGITEICINRFDEMYIEKQGMLQAVPGLSFSSEDNLATCVEQIARALGQPFDRQKNPILNARLPGGQRVNAVAYPYSTKGTCVNIRVFRKQPITQDDLLTSGSLTQEMLRFLQVSVRCRANIIFAGGTGSGKTTIMEFLAGSIPEWERIISVEDTHELKLSCKHWVALEAANKSIEADTPVTLHILLENVLRQLPERIIVGEVRTPAAADALISGMNTGHDGVLATLHANSAEDALMRLEFLVSAYRSSLSMQAVRELVRSNINLVVFLERNLRDRKRRITEIAEVTGNKFQLLWRYNHRAGAHERLVPNSSSDVLRAAYEKGLIESIDQL